MNIPDEIKDFLRERQNDTNPQCQLCNSSCCNGPGFALLENILLIYKKYQEGRLIRSDFHFKSDLMLVDFIFEYFDLALINSNLLAFFPKMITEDNQLISTPPFDFWNSRDYLKRRYKSYGCIFLEKKQTETVFTNKCILHTDKYKEEITEKPFDCLFLSCLSLKDIKQPTAEESQKWFELLNKHYPDSNSRFSELCPERIKYSI